MEQKRKKPSYIALCLLLTFCGWTAALTFIDVQPIGPQGSTVGFAKLNQCVHSFTGVNMPLYVITDWLGLIPVAFGMNFALLGLVQWIKRRNLKRVDRSILALGGFYIAVMVVYIFFEIVVVNYRPVLINGFLEASYPSSTTMLTMCVMPTTVMQLRMRMQNGILKRCVITALIAFTALMVIGRLISGVHWFSDIVGGALLSAALVMMYCRMAAE